MKTIDEYISKIPQNRIERFNELMNKIRKWHPDAELTMKYKMPTFELGDKWLAVANQKSYISVYTCGYHHIESYKEKHPETKTGKGCLNFRENDKINYKDLKAVAKSTLTS
jgi:uncharacterized protein YdhG (YjbR/CyaY superfamily)